MNFVFRFGNGLVQALLTNVAHVPYLGYHLFPLPTPVKNGHTFERRATGVVVKITCERSIVVSVDRDPVQPLHLPGRLQP